MESTNLDNAEVYPELSALERDQLRKQFNQEATAAWEHYQTTGLHITDEEMDDWLTRLIAGEDLPLPVCHT